MKKLVGIFGDSSRATKLMLFATVVAALRFMLLHAVATDFPLWSWFKPVEVFSGIAFAVLEGVALAYVSKRWRRFQPAGWTGWLYWVILAVGQLGLLLAITWTTGMAFMAVRLGIPIDQVLPPVWAAWWSMLVAGINPLIVLLIGIVEDDEPEAEAGPRLAIPVSIQARVFLEQWAEEHGREPTVPEMAYYFRELTGIGVSEENADQYIIEWRRDMGRVGARPTTPIKPVPAPNGRG